MDQVRRVVAVALIVLAVAVGLNLMLTPVYHDGGDTYPAWQVLNWFMAVAVVISLLISFHRVRALKGGPNDPVTREYLGATALFLGATGLIVNLLLELALDAVPGERSRPGRSIPHQPLPVDGRTLQLGFRRRRPVPLARRRRENEPRLALATPQVPRPRLRAIGGSNRAI